MLPVCLMAVHVVNQPNPSVNPHAVEAMTISSCETSSSLKFGERRVSITTASRRIRWPGLRYAWIELEIRRYGIFVRGRRAVGMRRWSRRMRHGKCFLLHISGTSGKKAVYRIVLYDVPKSLDYESRPCNSLVLGTLRFVHDSKADRMAPST